MTLNKEIIYRNILFESIVIGISSCIYRVDMEDTEVKEAIELQELVIKDPLFFKILKELDDNGRIKWQKDCDQSIPEI